MPAIRLTINGQRWTVTLQRVVTFNGHWCYGLCKHEQQEILIRSRIRGLVLADTVTHEVLHAHDWKMHEETISFAARHIALELMPMKRLVSRRRAKSIIGDVLSQRVFGLTKEFATAASHDIVRVLYNPAIRGRI